MRPNLQVQKMPPPEKGRLGNDIASTRWAPSYLNFDANNNTIINAYPAAMHVPPSIFAMRHRLWHLACPQLNTNVEPTYLGCLKHSNPFHQSTSIMSQLQLQPQESLRIPSRPLSPPNCTVTRPDSSQRTYSPSPATTLPAV